MDRVLFSDRSYRSAGAGSSQSGMAAPRRGAFNSRFPLKETGFLFFKF